MTPSTNLGKISPSTYFEIPSSRVTQFALTVTNGRCSQVSWCNFKVTLCVLSLKLFKKFINPFNNFINWVTLSAIILSYVVTFTRFSLVPCVSVHVKKIFLYYFTTSTSLSRSLSQIMNLLFQCRSINWNSPNQVSFIQPSVLQLWCFLANCRLNFSYLIRVAPRVVFWCCSSYASSTLVHLSASSWLHILLRFL